jgi:beta-glucosidase
LSYTSFEYRDLVVEPTTEGWAASVTVRNTGSRIGSEVVQLYVGRQGNGQLYPVKALKGFQRIVLDPGAEGRVRIELPREALVQRDGQGRSVPFTQGTLTITVGPHSQEGLTWTTLLP